MRNSRILLSLILLAGCSTLPSFEDRQAHADVLAAEHYWRAERFAAGCFELAAYLPRQVTPAKMLTIYIEGDGFAWVNGALPSDDPTPRDPLALRLALAQPEGNVAYLARPCQYVDAEKTHCPERYWTDARFAPEVIAATNQAVDALKVRFDARRLTLVGFSGGAAVAALVAAQRDDGARLVTVAGNLDHHAWTAHHRVEPLRASMNAADVASTLAPLPQTHFIGEEDKIVPPELARRWPTQISGNGATNLHIIADADHHCCWVQQWPTLFQSIK